MVVDIAFTLGRLAHAVQDQNSHVLMHLMHKVAVVDLLQLRYLDAPGCRRTLSLVWRTDAYRSAAARAFTEFAATRTWPSDA
jgi:hypothetical protein